MTDEKPEDIAPENVPVADAPVETEEAKKKRILSTMQHQVAMLMDELKSMFTPDMRLTFIARSTDPEKGYTLLTEETDNKVLADFLLSIKPPELIVRTPTSGIKQ